MVILHVKRGDESQFLYETNVDNSVDEVIKDIVAIFNGRLKVTRICYELDELREHGTFLPQEMQGLTDEQIQELKLEDPWAKRCAPQGYVFKKDEMGRRCGLAPPPQLQEVLKKAAETAKEIISKKHIQELKLEDPWAKRCAPQGYVFKKDEMGRRCGLAPPPQLQEVLKKAAETAKEIISKKHVDLRKCLTQKDIARALDELRGATKIVFPAGLPPHDPVRMELDNVEDLSGTQAATEVIDPSRACLWACGKRFINGNKLSDHLGKNDKSKVTVKLCSNSEGAPGREPIMTEEERKQLMLEAYRKQEEWKKLELDDDDHYLNSKWADGQNLKRQFHGLNDISWKPVLRK